MGGYCVTATGDWNPSGAPILRARAAGAYVRGSLAEKDLASGASVIASSAQPQHPASNAVDGNGNSFWASASDPSEKAPVDLTISLGGNSHVALIEIDWELPPKARRDGFGARVCRVAFGIPVAHMTLAHPRRKLLRLAIQLTRS